MTRLPAVVFLLTAVFSAGCRNAPEESAKAGTPSVAAQGDPADAWIVFASGRSGNGDIYALHPATGETVLVAGAPEAEGTVRYDAARDRLVYQRFASDDAPPVLASGGEDLFEDPNGDVAPAWSPSGDRIVYVAARDGKEDVYLARPDGSEERRLTDDDVIDRYPAWSPDGRRVVLARRLETGWDLHLLDPFSDPPALERLTHDGVYVGHPAWSPDGRFIAFDTWIDDQAEIAMIEPATGVVTRLTDRAGNDLIPAWSPDGRRVAFGGEPDGAGNWDLWVVDVATLEVERLTTQPTYDGGPVFVPPSAVGR